MKKKIAINVHILLLLNIVFCNNALTQNLFPEINGWNSSGEVKMYNPGNLWEYIDGAADYYNNYGFLKLEVKEYSRSEDEYIKAEIYNHNSPINAFGIYAYERTPEANFLKIGEEGYMVHSALNFYKGNFYVKIHSHMSDTATLNAIMHIANEIAKNILSESGTEAMALLPEENKIKHSEKYFPANFLGYNFLNTVLSADYLANENKYSIFIVLNKTNSEASAALQKYLDFSKVSGEAGENKLFTIDDFYNGKIYLQQFGNYLIGSVELQDVDEFKYIITEIVAELNK